MIRALFLTSRPLSWVNTAFPFGAAYVVASGRIEIPIAATYPLDDVRDAFAELERRHTRGKIVLIP